MSESSRRRLSTSRSGGTGPAPKAGVPAPRPAAPTRFDGSPQTLGLFLSAIAVGGIAAGAADTISVISRGSIVQLATPDSHRGRVNAAEHIVGVSGPHLGNFRGGLVAGATSASFAVISGGVLCVLAVGWLAAVNTSLRILVRGS